QWRKRMGVEPTKDRLSAPPGFEVRTPHQERVSSLYHCFSGCSLSEIAEQVQLAAVKAAHVSPPYRDAVAVKKLQYLDRHLASAIDPVAKARRDEPAAVEGRIHIRQYADHFRNRRPEEKMVVRHFMHPAHAPGELEQAANIFLPLVEEARNIAHARRTETGVAAKQRRDALPERLVGIAHRHFMLAEAQPRTGQ